MIFLDCYHSDSLTGYSFSHEGWWSDGFVLKQHVDNASECANLCNTNDDCIAFNYRYGDDKQCVGYKSLVSKTMRPGISRAYVKCVGMSRKIWLPCYIYTIYTNTIIIILIILMVLTFYDSYYFCLYHHYDSDKINYDVSHDHETTSRQLHASPITQIINDC